MSIKIEGLEEVQEKLKQLSEKVDGKGMKKVMQTIGNKVKNETMLSFENERSPFGERWKPLSANTAFALSGGRKKAYTKNGKRQRKGFLKRYGAGGRKRILVESGKLSTNWRVKATSNEVTISNNTSSGGFPYGLTHQEGTDNAFGKGIKVQARPFLPIDGNGKLEKSLEENILNTLSNEIEKVFK